MSQNQTGNPANGTHQSVDITASVQVDLKYPCDQCLIQAKTKVHSDMNAQRRHGDHHEVLTKED